MASRTSGERPGSGLAGTPRLGMPASRSGRDKGVKARCRKVRGEKAEKRAFGKALDASVKAGK